METSEPMKITALKIFLGLAAALLLFVAFDLIRLSGLGGEHKISRYADLAAARADGAFEGGWLPKLLPPGSTHIAETHDLGTNSGAGSFAFPSYQMDAYKTEVRQFGRAILRETGTTTRIIYHGDHSRVELTISPDPQKPEVMNGVWSMKPTR